jgi:hypothetical protein
MLVVGQRSRLLPPPVASAQWGEPVRGALSSYKPGFAFGCVTFKGGDFGAFARTLAEHPMVAQAWTQKLCRAANGLPCDTSDPEFVRVAKAWKDSHFSWKTLIVELYSSPLVTGLAPTTTWEKCDLPVSLVRGQHLCDALDARSPGLCGQYTIRTTIGLIPSDGFNSPLIYYCAPRIVTWPSLKIRLYSSVVLPSFAALAT